jgi:UDP-N-acetyl-D-mannosaminuronic acid dehydrogenase
LAFCNELHMVCDQMGLDFWKVVDLANLHPRVNIFKPNSAGVGGHCIAIDPWFIINAAPKITPFMRAAREVNDAKPGWVLGQVKRAIKRVHGSQEPGSQVARKKVVVACLGLSYKPDVDDLRESPSIEVVKALAGDEGVELCIVEPNLKEWDMPLVGLEKAIKAADVVVTLTAHKEFKELAAGALEGKQVVDAVGIFRGRGDVGSTLSRRE